MNTEPKVTPNYPYYSYKSSSVISYTARMDRVDVCPVEAYEYVKHSPILIGVIWNH